MHPRYGVSDWFRRVISASAALVLLLNAILSVWGLGPEDALAQGLADIPASSMSSVPTPPPDPDADPLLPDWMQTPASPAVPEALIDGFQIAQSVDTGTGDNSFAYNGELITYTIVLTNTSGLEILDITVSDALPRYTFDELSCDVATATYTECQKIPEVRQVPEPSGNIIVVTNTTDIEWVIPQMSGAGSGSVVTLALTSQLIGRHDGDVIENYVSINYTWIDGQGVYHYDESYNVPPLSFLARIRKSTTGGALVSPAPTWFSRDWGGTISQDWADFDHDGFLDLVLGSSLGTSVYRNVQGRLEHLWDNFPNDTQDLDYSLSYGVAWAEIDQDPAYLELVVVGDSFEDSSTSPGINYIYRYDAGEAEFVQTDVFTSDYQLVRVAPGDYDGDGDVDLVASSNWINAQCPVRLYRNDGMGHFTGTITTTMGSLQTQCVSPQATAALGASDYDNDGDLDLALGIFPSGLRVLTNVSRDVGYVITETAPFSVSHAVTVETNLLYIPYDLKWGDYDQDGYLDLAAAYPLQRRARIYQNVAAAGGRALQAITSTIRTIPFMTPLSVDWSDMTGDGRLDLVVADSPPQVYDYDAFDTDFARVDSFDLPTLRGQAWSIRGVDITNKHNLDLAVGSRDGASYIFDVFEPKLSPDLHRFPSSGGYPNKQSVAWGDVNQDRYLDLLLGAGAGQNGKNSIIYLYDKSLARFVVREPRLNASGFGPHVVAFGDVDGDGRLGFAIGGPEIQIYMNGADKPTMSIPANGDVRSLAWGDVNDDRKLDLLVGTREGLINLYLNEGVALGVRPVVTITVGGQVRSLVWGDYDGDYYLDFAAGVMGGATSVYTNYGNGKVSSFNLAWKSPEVMSTTSLAWADYDADGDLDLAVGNDGQPDMLWENHIGVDGAHTLGVTPVWTATTPASRTTSLAWGDWDNDGYPELAVGKAAAPDVVYINLESSPGNPFLVELWHSTESYTTTGVAWGDAGGDGDLDLAVSAEGDANGYYENTLAAPAHLDRALAAATPLPDNPVYLHVRRPGTSRDAYGYSTAEVMAWPTTQPTVTVLYDVYEPEADAVQALSFEYSLNGGSVFSPATEAPGFAGPVTQTTRKGTVGTFIWDAAADNAVSDNARFRICYTASPDVGPVAYAQRCAVSPPFRVRGLDCVWPAYYIDASDTNPHPGELVTFDALPIRGYVNRVEWNFGDGSATSDQFQTTHAFDEGTFTVTLRAEGAPCPLDRPSFDRVVIDTWDSVYFPMMVRRYAGTPAAVALKAPLRPSAPVAVSASVPAVPAVSVQVADEPQTVPTEPPQLSAPIAVSEPRPASAAPLGAPMPATASSAAAMQTFTPQSVRISPNAELFGSWTQRITNYALGVNSQPSVNQDGSRIAFWSTGQFTGENEDGNIEIFLADVYKDEIRYRQVTSSTGSILAGFNLAPTISDAGDRLAFFSDQDLVDSNADRNFEIYAAEIGAHEAITLLQVTRTPRGVNILPDISADGRFVVFASDLKLTEGGGSEQVVGQTALFRAELGKDITGTWQITYTDIAGFSQDRDQPALNDQPAINADGTRIAFVSTLDLAPFGDKNNRDHNREIFLAEVLPGGEVTYTQITSSTEGIHELPAISADGTHIAFVSNGDFGNNNADRSREVFLAHIAATGSITPGVAIQLDQITSEPSQGISHDQPNISADGARIAYVREVFGNSVLGLYDTYDQEDIVNDQSLDKNYAFPSLSGDGTKLAYVSDWLIYVTTYPLADLEVSKTSSTSYIASPGEHLTYTVQVENLGPSPATRVVMTDHVPPGLVLRMTDYRDLDYVDDPTGVFTAGDEIHGVTWSGDALELTANTNAIALPGNGVNDWLDMRGNVLLLPLDGDSQDASGLSNHGSCAGTCSLYYGAGKLDDAVDLQANHAVNVGAAASLEMTRALSFAAWILPQGAGSGGSSGGILINKEGEYEIARFPDGTIRWALADVAYGSWYWTDTGYVAPLNQWTHLVFVYDAGAVRLYANGRLVYEDFYGSGTLGDIDALDQCWIGGRESSSQYFEGRLDEVALFNRPLSEAEAGQIYRLQAPDRAGYFDSRVMTDTARAGWRALSWLPYRPIGKELPDERGAESGYPDEAVNMAGNVLLLHLNDPAGISAFLDTSGQGNDGQCFGNWYYGCPESGIDGQFDGAVRFDYYERFEVPPSPSLANIVTPTVMMWVKRSATSYGYLFYKYPGLRLRFTYDYDTYSTPVLRVDRYSEEYGYVWWETTSLPQEGEWAHLAVVQTGFNSGDVKIYVNGTSVPITDYGGPHGSPATPRNDENYSLYIGYLRDDTYLDEISVFNRALDATEIKSHYLRGAAGLRFQARSCAVETCDDTPFVGPDNTSLTYYSELDNATLSPPTFTLDLDDEFYFQYRVYMENRADSVALSYPPKLYTVTVSPRAECMYTGEDVLATPTLITCTLSTRYAPMDLADPVQVRVPVMATKQAGIGGEIISNTARVFGDESDHNALNDLAYASTAVEFIAPTGVKIEGESVGETDKSHTFDAAALPLAKVSLPVTYTWTATGHPTPHVDHAYSRGTLTSTHAYTWNSPMSGTKRITVTAQNPYGSFTATHIIDIYHPIEGLAVASTSPSEYQEEITYFTATITQGDDVSYIWDFGDGAITPTTASEIGYMYPHTGTYTAIVTATNPVDDDAVSTPVLVRVTPSISATKVAVPNPSQVGSSLTYRIFVTNTCRTNLHNVLVTDTLPLSVTHVSGSDVLTWSLGTLPPLSSAAPIEFSVTVTGTKWLPNHVEVSSTEGATATHTIVSVSGNCFVNHNSTIYNKLQDAVAVASPGDLIKVAGECTDAANYHPSGWVGYEVAYITKSLTIRGGYVNGSWFTSDPVANPTYLTANDHGRVLFVDGAANVTIENIDILDGGVGYHGGGVYIDGSTVTFNNVRLYSNRTKSNNDLGGAIYAVNAGLNLYDTEVYNNETAGNDGDGGAIYVDSTNLIIENSALYDNAAQGNNSMGGALFIKDSTSARVSNTVIRDNVSEDDGGAIYVDNGDDAVLENVIIANNRVEDGDARGGVFIYRSNPVALYHTTIVSNTGGVAAGVFIDDEGSDNCTVSFYNTIIANQNIGVKEIGDGNAVSMDATLWSNVTTQREGDDYTVLRNYTGSPAFVDPAGRDYHIQANSEAIDLGVPTSVSADIDGDARPSSNADLGADEYPHTMQVSKAASVSAVEPGVPFVYTVYITNTGGQSLSSITLSDTMPADVHFIGPVSLNPTPPGANIGSPPILVTDAALNSGESFATSFLVSVTVGVSSSVTIDNFASVTCTEIAAPVVAAHSFDVANVAPVAQDDTAAMDEEDAPITIAVLTNDSDANNDPLSVGSVGAPNLGETATDGATVTYTPTNHPTSYEAVFVYTVTDGALNDTGRVTVTVSADNDPPDAVDDTDSTDEDTPVTVNVLSNDTDPEQEFLSVTVAQPPHGSVVVNGDRTVTYTPPDDYNGVVGFVYTITDPGLASDQAWVTITVAAVEDPPEPVDDHRTTNEDTPLTIAVLANDDDPDGDPLTVIGVGTPQTGTASANGISVFYTPTNQMADYTVTFPYTVTDSSFNVAAQVVITVTADNDAPTATDDITATRKNQPVEIYVLSNDTDPENLPLTVVAVGEPAHGNPVISGGGQTITYNPDSSYSGVDVFTYTVQDAGGLQDTATVTVNITSHSLDISKAAPATVVPGATIDYTIYYSITGSQEAKDVMITDTVPVSTTYVANSCTGGNSCSYAGGVVTWDLGDRPAGTSGSVTFQAKVALTVFTGTQIFNQVTIYDDDGNDALASATTDVQSTHALAVSKSAQPASQVHAGELLTYTIEYQVTGNEYAPNLTLTDTLPSNVQLHGSCPGASCPSGYVIWNLGTQAPGSPQSVQVVVQVDSPLPMGTNLVNSVLLADDDGVSATDTEAVVVASHTLSVSKAVATPAPVSAGGQIAYTIYYTVTGNEAAPNVVISDPAPANTTFAACTGGCTNGTWNLSSVAVGNYSQVITFDVASPLPNGTVLTNVVSIDDDSGLTDAYTVTAQVQSDHALQIDKSAEPAQTVRAGELLTYTLYYTITGNETSLGVTISDTTPVSTTFQSCTDGCAHPTVGDPGLVTWSLGDLDPGADSSVELVVQVDPLAAPGDTITNTATITDTQGKSATASDVIRTVDTCWVQIEGDSTLYFTLQGAVNASAAGDVLQVAGSCLESTDVVTSVTIEGGYDKHWNGPDFLANPTTLDAEGQGRVLTIDGAYTVTLAHLRLTGGAIADNGAGVFVRDATVLITDSHIVGNQTASGNHFGGGVHATNATLTVCHSLIANNTINASASSGFLSGGGGVSAVDNSVVLLCENRIQNNYGGDSGGGVFADGAASVVITASVVLTNTADDEGGGILLGNTSDALLVNSWILYNRALGNGGGLGGSDGGGGIYLDGTDATLINNVVARNYALDRGGGLYIDASPKLIHTTLDANTCDTSGCGAAMEVFGSNTVQMTNTILSNHGVGIRVVDAGSSAHLTATLWYNNVSQSGGPGTVITRVAEYVGNPGFVNPSAGNYHILNTSPAQDKGVNAGVTFDIDGQSRPQPPGPSSDLGADEYSPVQPPPFAIAEPVRGLAKAPAPWRWGSRAAASPLRVSRSVSRRWY